MKKETLINDIIACYGLKILDYSDNEIIEKVHFWESLTVQDLLRILDSMNK